MSISGFGQTGPLAHRPAYDIIVQAMSGLMEATGEPEGPPTMVGEAVSDVIAGLFASWATLAALLQQRRTGQGQHVDVAMFDATLAFLVTGVGRYLFTGESARRSGNRHSFSAPFGVYRARDGHFALAVLNNKLFATLAALIGVPGFAQDARFATNPQRVAHRSVLIPLLRQTTVMRTTAEWVSALEQADVPCGPVNRLDEVFADPQVQARGIQVDLPHPLGTVATVASPVRLSATPVQYRRPPPLLGQHTQEVLHDWLQSPLADPTESTPLAPATS